MQRANHVSRALVGVVVLSFAQAACGAQEDVVLGSVVVPLLTETNGVRYRLPDGAYLEITNDAYFYQEVDLSGDQTLETFQLPAGEFDVTLLHTEVTGTVWPLTRIDIDDSESTVDAEMVSPNPAGIVIAGDETTSLVLRFELPTLERVTFHNGSLDVSLDVDLSVASQGTSTGTSTITSESYSREAPADLPTVLTMEGHSYVHSLDMSVFDEWYSSDTSRVCVHLATEQYAIDASDGLALILAETTADGGKSRICIEDPKDPIESNKIQVSQYRVGPATTSLSSTLTGESYLFYVIWSGYLPTDVLEVGPSETILDVNLLRQQTTIDSGSLISFVYHPVSGSNLYLSDGIMSDFTIQLER